MRKRKVLRLVFVATILFTTPVFRLGGAGIASEYARCVARLWFALMNGTERATLLERRGIVLHKRRVWLIKGNATRYFKKTLHRGWCFRVS